MKSLEIRFSVISLICACITILFGALVLLGWFFQVLQLVQLTPLAFIQANTAACFLISGLALLLLDRSHLHSVRILSFIVLAFGLLTLCEYLFNISLGIDELLFKDFILSGASHPNRMAPNTALSFSLLATALYTATYLLRSNKGNLTTATLSALVFVLASVALSGFMVGLEEAFGWGAMTRMSPQTAIGLLIISTGLICLAWKNAVKVDGSFPLWSAPFASMMVLTIFVGIWQSLVTGERQFMQSEIRLRHDSMISKLSFEIKDRLLALNRMGSRFEKNYKDDNYRTEWEADAANYLKHFSDFNSISWVDSDYHAQWTLLSDGSKNSQELIPIESAQLLSVMHLAQETRKTLISSVFTNFEGNKIFSIITPLFYEDTFIGFVRGNYVVNSLMEKLLGEGKGEIQSSIYDGGQIIFERKIEDPGRIGQWLISTDLEYKGLKWLIKCIPSRKYLADMRSAKPEVVMGFGLILAWALGAAIRSSQKAREHERNLISINRKLTNESVKGQYQSKALELSRKKYKDLFSQVKNIIERVSHNSGSVLYSSLAQYLAESIGFKYSIVGELDSEDSKKVNTLAVWGDGKFLENFSYGLTGTLFENVMGETLCTYSSNVWKQFPEDEMLADLNIESFIGISLTDSSNNPLGILLAMHDEPIVDLTNEGLIFPLFAEVISSEMERQLYENELQHGSEMIRVSRDIAIAANDFTDFELTLKFALNKLCKFIGWPVGHLYLKDDYYQNLMPTRVWHFDDPERYKTLKEVTEDTTFVIGQGLPGRVMRTGRPEWVKDVYADPNFPRAEKSDKLGIKSALACPIIIRKQVVGVIEFFTPCIQEVDADSMELVEQVGIQVARVLERNKSEEILKQQAQVLEHIHDAVISLDEDFNITGWNKGAERVIGYEEVEMLGKHISYLFPDVEDALAEKLIQPTIINGRLETEIEMVHKSGGMFYAHISMSAVCEQDCIPKSFICYALDITEKKQAKEQLEIYSATLEKRVEQRTAELNASLEKIKESRDQTEGILRSIGEGLIVTDLSGTIVLMNFAAEKILAIKVCDALGKAADKIVQNEILLNHMLDVTGAQTSGQPFEFVLGRENEPDGGKFVQGISSSTHSAEGSLVGSVTVLRDVTFERKVDNLKSQFLSTAAHELRTPLTTLQGFSEILLNKKNLPAKSVARYLKYINEESLRLGKIINDFLDISRIESGREISLDKRTCEISDIINRSAQIFGEAHKESHEFVFKYLSKNSQWNVDLGKMEQVFKNLYSNAIKYSPDGGEVTTTVCDVNGHIEVAIEDQGVGMKKEEVDKIFDKYYRGENMERSVPGSGLGMTIVKYILEAHGGNISVESEPGKGTKVVICIPNN